MHLSEPNPHQLSLEGRAVTQRGWLIWGGLFFPGLIALLLAPESYRFIGLLVWIVIWLAMIAVVPRWLGDLIRVTIDCQSRQIVWTRNGKATKTLSFDDVKSLGVGELATGARPYKTFQLYAALKDGKRVTLAVDPNESEIRRALGLAREHLRPS